MENKITINDIAKYAGVGKSTVSRFFNGGYVKEETREKIEKVVNEYNYQPNKVAQNLKLKKSNVIGIIVPSINSRTMARTVNSIEKNLHELGYTTIIINTTFDNTAEIKALYNLFHMQVDGIILFATIISDLHHEAITKINIPVIIAGQHYEDGISIINKDYEAGYQIGNIVGEKGYKKILYLTVSENDISVGVKRKQGVFDGLANYKIDFIKTIETDFTYDKTRTVIKGLINELEYDLIICTTDNIAMAVYKELQTANIKIPDQVGVVAFGGYESSELLHPSLQTIIFDNVLMGDKIAENLVKMIKQENVDKLLSIDYKIINGESI